MAEKKTSSPKVDKKDTSKVFQTADGQTFKRGTEAERLQYARNHAFKFHPPLEIKEVK